MTGTPKTHLQQQQQGLHLKSWEYEHMFHGKILIFIISGLFIFKKHCKSVLIINWALHTRILEKINYTTVLNPRYDKPHHSKSGLQM